MLKVTQEKVVAEPFPHVISQQILDPDMYSALRDDYPDASVFTGQKEASGLSGSRTGQGFDIYRGDDAYARLIERSEAWREFDAYINSARFVEDFLSVFGPFLPDIGCGYRLEPSMYDREFIEPREVMRPKATLSERLAHYMPGRHTGNGSAYPGRLFTRLDIHKALTGYAKPVHCDRANRLASLIVYFCDAEKIGLRGGELTIHQHKKKKPFHQYERHPHEQDVHTIAKIAPKENLGVFFPCCNNSYHAVTAVETDGIERDYLYINISGEPASFW